MHRSLVAVLALPILLNACSRSRPTNLAETRHTLDSLLTDHGRQIIAGDIAGIVERYAPDAVVRSNHAEPLRGQPAIRSFVEGMLTNMTFRSLTYRTEALAVYGDSAWHIATYGLTGAMANEPIADSGSVYFLWIRDSGGEWRVKDDILNSRLPLPPPPSVSR